MTAVLWIFLRNPLPVYSPEKCSPPADDTYFNSANEPGESLCYDFKDRRVTPTHYSIRTHFSNCHLQSWVLEGSLDGMSWAVLDQQTNNATTSNHPIGTFPVSRSVECRFVRLRQTGKAANETDDLVLLAVELFGSLQQLRLNLLP
jgi:hypothetical protein